MGLRQTAMTVKRGLRAPSSLNLSVLTPAFGAFAATAATATNGFYILVPIMLAIAIAKLFARFYVALGNDENALIVFLRLAIGRAGMIDIARHVFAAAAVYRQVIVKLEEILAAAFDHLFFADDLAPIFRDNIPFFDRTGGE